ncbi:hypothetical protein GGH92_007746, partial [Coemansia sp. RSA 2673]
QLDDERNVVYRLYLYNCNLAATLNFRHIIQYLIRKGDIPPVFKCPTRLVAAMPTPTSMTATPTSMTARGRVAARAAVAEGSSAVPEH